MATYNCALCGEHNIADHCNYRPEAICQPCARQCIGLLGAALGIGAEIDTGAEYDPSYDRDGVHLDWSDVLAFLRRLMAPVVRVEPCQEWRVTYVMTDRATERYVGRAQRTLAALSDEGATR